MTSIPDPFSENEPRIGGHFLIASPYLTDGHFFRRVVLMIRHEAEGALGVVINEASGKCLSQISDDFQHATTLVYRGGPVQGPLLAIHDVAGIGDPCQIASGDEVMNSDLANHPADAFGSLSIQWAETPAWITADEDHLRILAKRSDARVRFVMNYSGWGPGQLEAEIEAGGWLITPADTETLFDQPDEVWEILVKRCGRSIIQQLAPEINLPPNGEPFDSGMN